MNFLNIWRTTVSPGDVTYIWSRQGHLPAGVNGSALGGKAFTLDDSIPLKQFSWGDSFIWRDSYFATGLTVPAEAEPGTYHLHIQGQDTSIAITVRARPASMPIVEVPPSGKVDSANIQAALNAGKSVRLSAGVYTIDRTITVPGGASVRGSHRDATILIRTPSGKDYKDTLFTSTGDDISFSDFTADGMFAPGAVLFHNYPGSNRRAVFQRLRLRTMTTMMWTGPESLVQDIELKYCGGFVGGDHSLWKDISFEGYCDGGNECIAYGDQFAMINASWRDTGRGIILRRGPTNSFFSRLVFDGIQYANNGDEVILVEDASPGLQGCIFFHVRVRNCDGPAIQFWASPASDNYFRGVQVNGGLGINLWPDGKVVQTNNLFEDVELRGCAGISLGGATGNTFKGLAIISPRPTWSNQEHYSAKFYPRTSSAIRGSKGNVFNPLTIMDLPEGWTAMD
ncbi:MAG TPA: hypothetical protein VGG44_01445 [Tepidisphaeraceae bacterium]